MRTIFRAAWRAVCPSALAALLAACGTAQTGVNPVAGQALSALRVPSHGTSGALLYVAGNHIVQVFTYPAGAPSGSSNTPGAVSAMCSDASGNVFITEAPKKSSHTGTGYVEEYAHGGTTPIASLAVPAGEMPMDCSSDATTGNLAVTEQKSSNYAPSVAIYSGASGTPKILQTDAIGADPQCGYDDAGNLFVTSGGNVGAELAAGKSAFKTVTLDRTLGGVKHAQWDGKYFALQSFRSTHHNGDIIEERIYRVAVSGSTGKITGITEFKNWPEKVSGSSWIDGGTIVGTPASEIAFWKYPDGGKAAKTMHLKSHMAAVTISSGK
ncbi:MAG: hypothetical protein WA431_05145 [Candidatus Cybelea sp.]